MAGFLYFIPQGASPADRGGLSYALGKSLESRKCLAGPDKNAGTMLADPARVPADLVGYYPERQTWRQIPGSTCWVGFTNDKPPTPTDLARAEQLRGHMVTLSDGNEWLIPVARALRETEGGEIINGGCVLPTMVDVNASGEWVVGVVHPKHAKLWDAACAWLPALTGAVEDAGQFTFDMADALDAALVALGTNYAVGKIEAAMLGLFDDQRVFGVLGAVIDLPTFAAWHKKKAAQQSQAAPAGSNIDAGPSADTADTGLVLQT